MSHHISLFQVTGKDQPFQNIMRCYRLQPQAQSHVSNAYSVAQKGAVTHV